MKISLSGSKDNCVIDIDGELDRDTLTVNLWESLSTESRSAVEAAQEVCIDLNKVARADTAGLAWLLNAMRDIQARKKSVSITNIPKKLVDLADLSNAGQLITKQRG